jgi:hypothetical protein
VTIENELRHVHAEGRMNRTPDFEAIAKRLSALAAQGGEPLKPGDRVRASEGDEPYFAANATGTVISVCGESVKIQFDEGKGDRRWYADIKETHRLPPVPVERGEEWKQPVICSCHTERQRELCMKRKECVVAFATGNQVKPQPPMAGDLIIGATRHYGGDDWFRELTIGGVTFLAPLDQQEQARHMLAAAPTPEDGRGDAVRALVDIVLRQCGGYLSGPAFEAAELARAVQRSLAQAERQGEGRGGAPE